MIKQGLGFDGILEKKYKILKTSIILGNLTNKDEILSEFENTSRELDRIKNGLYEEKLSSYQYTTITLEEEKNRLNNLIECIENRVNEKNMFIDDYIKLTSNYIDDLEPVNGENELNNYKIRYSNIDEYLRNNEEINSLNDKVSKLRHDLEERYDNKNNNELINERLEEELKSQFNKFISGDEYYSSISYSEIDNTIDNINAEVNEKETVMNTFISSYQALISAGISGTEKEEYSGYVNDARSDYYKSLEKRFILQLYKLVFDKVDEYGLLCDKRDKINALLYERNTIRNKLGIIEKDKLEYFIKLCDEQLNIIKSQKYVLDDIDNLIVEISECENRLSELEIANNRKEIVDILDEYGLKREVEQIENNPIEEEIIETGMYFDDKVSAPNMVVSIKEPARLNIKTAKDMANLVMKKVVIVLEPNKDNKDKLTRAEEELKEKDRIDRENKSKSLSEKLGINFEEKNVYKEDNNKINISVEDDTFTDNIEASIFVDEPKKEEVDLFSNTDPFLDDNYIVNEEETEEKENKEDMVNGFPRIFSIGTVKPNSTFAKIEDAIKDNDNVILPTMGLSNMENEKVPIVSDNYIN